MIEYKKIEKNKMRTVSGGIEVGYGTGIDLA